jgi:PPK2 family polyphosphate:nucleotide phosphotransferase
LFSLLPLSRTQNPIAQIMSLKKFAPWKIQADDRFKLSDIPTRLPAGKAQVDEAKWLKSLFERLNKMQNTLYAAKSHGLLLVLQGMDTAGKDGVIRHVFTHVSPLGVRAQPFAAPTDEESRHDFLWRIHSKLPAKGEMVIFNRSHYEDVLVPQVRGLLKPAMIEKRLAHIRNFEALLQDEGITVLKCFLHISKSEQKKRLQARLEDPQKQWKLQASDFEDRKLWPAFMRAYQQTLSATSTKESPWYIIPADDKSDRNLFLAELLVNTLEDMHLKMPQPSIKPGSIKLV